MIRGVDRQVHKAIKDAAKAEGVSVGVWVRRALLQAIEASADGPATVMDLVEKIRMLTARLDVLEMSHHSLHPRGHMRGHALNRLTAKSANERTKWRRTKKSK